jgi:hypothetical protein
MSALFRIPLFCVALWLWAASGVLHAQVVFNADAAPVSLAGQMQFLSDDDNRLAFVDALQAWQQGRFRALPGKLSRSYTAAASWLTFNVSNDGAVPSARCRPDPAPVRAHA